MYVAIIYESMTGTTKRAAEFIKEGIESTGAQAGCFSVEEADCDAVKEADGVIMGSPTYMAPTSYKMHTFLQTVAGKLKLAGKLGGAFATEQYIHGGAENVITTILTHEMVFGMMVYSGGGSYGKPIIHLGPVGMSQNIDDFKELFVAYGSRFASQLGKIK